MSFILIYGVIKLFFVSLLDVTNFEPCYQFTLYLCIFFNLYNAKI